CTNDRERVALPRRRDRVDRAVDRRAGDPSADTEQTSLSASSGAVMRVMTWNIHGGVGLDGRFDLARIVDAIAQHAPDVVALQEVDSRRRAAQGPSPFTFLREAIGQHGIEAKSITTADGDYGQMVISRWPLQAVQIHDITVAQREPRRAIQADVIAPAGTVR